MPTFRLATPEELAILNSKVGSIVKPLTPEEQLDKVHFLCRRKGIRIQRFHFTAIENGTKLVLFDGNKKKHGDFSKDRNGIIAARRLSVKLFTDAVMENRNGGFKFNCLMIDEFGALKEKKED